MASIEAPALGGTCVCASRRPRDLASSTPVLILVGVVLAREAWSFLHVLVVVVVVAALGTVVLMWMLVSDIWGLGAKPEATGESAVLEPASCSPGLSPGVEAQPPSLSSPARGWSRAKGG
jgi:hypothetical protein